MQYLLLCKREQVYSNHNGREYNDYYMSQYCHYYNLSWECLKSLYADKPNYTHSYSDKKLLQKKKVLDFSTILIAIIYILVITVIDCSNLQNVCAIVSGENTLPSTLPPPPSTLHPPPSPLHPVHLGSFATGKKVTQL